jgi:PAS domain S-box-containing protein
MAPFDYVWMRLMKILYVEDEIAHVLLTQRTLEENIQLEFTLAHVETIREALSMLDAESDFDLILSDLRLPDGTGLDLLKKVRERTAPPAVVLVTGQGEQEDAVAALKAGAADYLVKQSDYLHRLPIVITNAIAQNRYLREQGALREAEIRYRALVEQIPAVVFLDTADDSETTFYMSPRIRELTGYTSDEWYALPRIWLDSIHPVDLQRITAAYEKSHENGTPFFEEYRFIRRDGQTIWIKEDTNLIRDKDGNPLYWQGILLDITNQKENETALQRQLRELSVLHSVATAGAESYSEDEIIERVTKIIRQIYPEVCGILKLNDKGNMLMPHSSYQGAEISNWSLGFPITRGLTGKSIRIGKTVRVGDVEKESEYIEIASGIRSELCVPIRVHERLIGVLNVESKRLNAFSKNDELLLNTIASSLGTTLEKLRLFKEEQRRAQELNSLYHATKSLTQSLKPEIIAEKLIATLDELLEYEFGAVYLLENQEQMLTPLAISQKAQTLDIYNKEMELLLHGKRGMDQGIIGWVAGNGQAIRTGDVSTEPRYYPVIKHIQSNLCVPLIARGKTIGIINIESTRRNAYTEQDENLLTAVAGSAAIALENAQLYEAELKRREQAELLRESTAALTTTIEPGALYGIILDALLKVVPYDSASIELMNEGYWEIVAGRGLPDEFSIVGTRYRTKQEKWGGLENKQHPVIIPDVRLDQRFVKFEGTEYIRSWMGVPMYAHGSLIGYLNLDSRTVNFYTKEHAALAQTFGNQAAAAFENAHLFQLEQRRRREAETLRQAATAISSTLDSNYVMEEILKALKQVIDYDSASVFLHEGDSLRLVVCQGFDEPDKWIDQKFPADNELFRQISTTRRPVIIKDLQSDPRFKNWGDTYRVHGWMATPLISRGRVIGYITLESYLAATYDEANIDTAMAFAYQAAAAIENARLYDESQRRLSELEAINHLSASLRITQSVDEMLEILLNATLNLINTEHGSIWLYDAVEEKLVQRAARGLPVQFRVKAVSMGTGSIVGHVFLTGTPHISTELANDPLASKENLEITPPGLGGFCIPIHSTAGTIGALMIALKLGNHATDQINLLTTLAEIAGNSIHRAQLFEHNRQQIRRLTTLRDIDATIASSFDLRLTLNILMDQTIKHLGVHAIDICLYHPELQSITYLGGSGFQSSSATRPLVRIGEGLAGQVIIRHKTFHITDLQNSPEIKNEPFLKREGFVTYIGIPLIVKGQIKGVFEVFHRTSLLPTPDWMEFLHTLAGQAAIAIDNSQLFENLQRSNQELMQAYDTTLEGWARALELRDRETEGHTRRVTELTLRLAQYMGISENEMVNIHRGVLLHDIGKMGVPDNILKKTGALNPEEWQEMRQHPGYAYKLLSPISYLRGALDIPYCHHEHWDGSGYPRGLRGEQIPLAARIFSVVDIWDALLSDRPYRKAWPQAKVINYLQEIAGTHLDPGVVEVFLKMIKDGGLEAE